MNILVTLNFAAIKHCKKNWEDVKNLSYHSEQDLLIDLSPTFFPCHFFGWLDRFLRLSGIGLVM